ncbi:MAG: CoA transferase [Rhodospirillaceae bacterium]|nr:CoA transferase [Rhodospirillaceae bacterium]
MTSNGRLPLSRFTVLDLTAHRAGPTCVRQLGDWGADVIKIEAPDRINKDKGGIIGARHGLDFQNLHRNKRSLTINLKTEEGKKIFFKLVEKADVIVENYRSAVKHRLGIDYEPCAKVNPRIVYASIAGFGQDGPYGKRPGVDQIAQGLGGLMSVTGMPGQGPVRVGIPICDLTAGMFLAQATLIALLDREVTGEGQWVHTSLLESMIQMMDFQASRYLVDGDVPKQAGNNHPTSIPTGVFETADGHINIAASGQVLFERFCGAVGLEHLVNDPDYAKAGGRSDNRDALNKVINERISQEPSQHWVDLLNEVGVPCGPIYSVDQVFADPQVEHLKMAKTQHHPELGDIKLVGQAINLTKTPEPEEFRLPVPELGEHTDSILADLGYGEDQISDMKSRDIV